MILADLIGSTGAHEPAQSARVLSRAPDGV
jgi:hypothetical protein